jgi:hypothetical protein
MRLTGLLATLVFAAGQSSAGFTNSFDGITSGSSVSLTWDTVQPQQYPLYITAQAIEKSTDGFGGNGYRVNLTSTWSLAERKPLVRRRWGTRQLRGSDPALLIQGHYPRTGRATEHLLTIKSSRRQRDFVLMDKRPVPAPPYPRRIVSSRTEVDELGRGWHGSAG